MYDCVSFLSFYPFAIDMKQYRAKMFNTTTKSLIKSAALVWYTGVVVLITKSSILLLEAVKNGAGHRYIFMAVLCGIVLGMIKGKYQFYTICKKNIDRINELAEPEFWQFYRKRFFVFLFLMIALGKYLSGVVHGNNTGLILLAMLEISIACALFFSSRCFWKK